MQKSEANGGHLRAFGAKATAQRVAKRKERGASYPTCSIGYVVQQLAIRHQTKSVAISDLQPLFAKLKNSKGALAQATAKGFVTRLRGGNRVFAGPTDVPGSVFSSPRWRRIVKESLLEIEAAAAPFGGADESPRSALTQSPPTDEVKRLRSLLQPFARMGRKWSHLDDDAPAVFTRADRITMADFKAAAAELDAAAAIDSRPDKDDIGPDPADDDDLSRYTM